VQACLPKDEAGNFIAGHEKSDVVHDLLAHLAEKMLEANMQKQQEIRDPPGWKATWGQRSKTSRRRRSYRATTSTITRAFWRHSRRTERIWPSILPAGSRGNGSDSMGTIGKLRPLLERIEKTDRLIDGCAALRSHGRGDPDSGRADSGTEIDPVVIEPGHILICELITQNK